MDDLQKPGLLSGGQVSRREVLKKGLIGAAGLTVLPTVIAACSSTAATPTAAPAATAAPTVAPATAAPTTAPTPAGQLTGVLKIGSNHSDPSEVNGMTQINAAFVAATGLTPSMNTVDHNTFQDQINSYLGGTPDDAFTWFSGFRMRFFASKGLSTPDRRRLGQRCQQLHRGLHHGRHRRRQARLRHPGRLLPVVRLLSPERLHRQGLHRPEHVGGLPDPVRQDED